MKFTMVLIAFILSIHGFSQKSIGEISFVQRHSKVDIPKQEDKFDFVGSGALILVGSTAALLFTKHDSPSVRTPVLMLMGAGYTMMIGGAISKDRMRSPKEL